jgi:hypothetical protein
MALAQSQERERERAHLAETDRHIVAHRMPRKDWARVLCVCSRSSLEVQSHARHAVVHADPWRLAKWGPGSFREPRSASRSSKTVWSKRLLSPSAIPCALSYGGNVFRSHSRANTCTASPFWTVRWGIFPMARMRRPKWKWAGRTSWCLRRQASRRNLWLEDPQRTSNFSNRLLTTTALLVLGFVLASGPAAGGPEGAPPASSSERDLSYLGITTE